MDSDNILSILSYLGGQSPTPAAGITPTTYQPISAPTSFVDPGPPPPPPPGYSESAPASNVLEAIAPPDYSNSGLVASEPAPTNLHDAAIAIGMDPGLAAQIAPKAAPAPQQQPAESPRKRRSVIETIGRLADVFAKVGGAEALYEPTLNARTDRLREIDMEALRKQLLEHQVRAGGMEVDASERKRLGTALGALVGRENPAALWPAIAEQAGIDPQKTAAIGAILQANPDAAGIFARSLGADIDNLGKNVYFGTDPQGKTVAYQVGEDGQPHILDFGGKLAPSDPTKVINTGGASVIVGSGGQIKRVLPNTERPGGAADRASRERIAAMRGPGTGKTAANPAQLAASAAPIVRDLRDAVTRLHNSGGMTDEKSGALDVASAAARENIPGYERVTNPAGFSARQDLERLLTVGIPALLPLMGGLQLGGKNIDAAKELETWRKAIASAKDYPSAIRAIEGFERRIAELKAAPSTTPVKPNSKAASGWSIVKVQ